MRHHHHMPSSSYLFPFVDGDTFTSSHWSQTEFSSTLKSFLRRAGCQFLYLDVDDPTGHSFRRALTTIAEEEGVSPDFVTRYLRWAMDLCRIRYTHSTSIVAIDIARALTSALQKELSAFPMSRFYINRTNLPPSRGPVRGSVRAATPSPSFRSSPAAPVILTASASAPSSSSPLRASPLRAATVVLAPPAPVFIPQQPRHQHIIPRHQHVVIVDESDYQAAGYGIGREQYLLAQPLPAKRTRSKPAVYDA